MYPVVISHYACTLILVDMQYYLADVIRVSNPALMSALVVAIGIAVGIPTSMVAGPLSDSVGRKPIVCILWYCKRHCTPLRFEDISSGIMSLAALVYLLLSAAPNIYGVFVVAIIFGLGYGAYKSVDWALALEVIPNTAAAKDMGVSTNNTIVFTLLMTFRYGKRLWLYQKSFLH